ncbi:MAG: anti-sigma factor [Rhodospirillaceae bacterium]
MTEHMRPSEEDLQAYIDGELDAARAADVEAAIQGDADLARQTHAYRADKARLGQIYGPLIDRPLPEAWLEMIANRKVVALPPRTSRRQMIGLATAASVAVIAGGAIVVRKLSERSGEALLASALAAHGQAREIPAQPVPEGALTKIVGVAVKTPDLSKLGFSLVGMRTQDGPGRSAAAVLAYRDAGGRVFTLYLKASPGTPAFEMIKRGDTRICLWQDDVLSTVMLADVSAAEMLRLASLAYSGLTA